MDAISAKPSARRCRAHLRRSGIDTGAHIDAENDLAVAGASVPLWHALLQAVQCRLCRLDDSDKLGKRGASLTRCSEPIVGQASLSTEQEKLEKALSCMQSALQLVDDADAPADIGAHLDLAICRLKELLAQASADNERAPASLPQRRS